MMSLPGVFSAGTLPTNKRYATIGVSVKCEFWIFSVFRVGGTVADLWLLRHMQRNQEAVTVDNEQDTSTDRGA